MKHIILEGPDGAGKTWLAQQLCKQYGGLLYHHEGVPPSGGDSLLHYYAERLLAAKRPTVFDRFHLGEMVYGPLIREQSRITGQEAILMNRLLIGTGCTVIGCLPKFSTCTRNTRSKEELIKDERILMAAYEQWQRLFFMGDGLLLPNGMVYDYESTGALFLQPPHALENGAIGSTCACFLFVGEKSSGTLDLPFFGAEHRSSGYLNAALVEAGFKEHHCAFTNAQYPDGTSRNLARIVLGFHKPLTLVALGKIAEQTIKNQKIQHMSIVDCIKQAPHPAFWKRFHASEQQDYVAMLREIHRAA